MKICKNLGIEVSYNIERKMIKNEVKKEYVRGLGLILNTELSTEHRRQGIGTLSTPVPRYSFRIINWNQE
jgi:hypothetical protein